MVTVFKNVGERCTAKNCRLVSLCSVVSDVFKKFANNRLVDIEKFSLFSDLQHGFRYFQSTADLLAVVSDSIARNFNKSGATRTVGYPWRLK